MSLLGWGCEPRWVFTRATDGSGGRAAPATFALLATLTIIVVFAFASHLGDSLSRIFLFAWALGLLLVAPVARYFAKAILMKCGLWGKPVVIFGDHEGGSQIVNVLQEEWQLGLRPVGLFDNTGLVEGAPESAPYLGTLGAATALADETVWIPPSLPRKTQNPLI